MSRTRLLQDMVNSITSRGLRVLDFSAKEGDPRTTLAALCEGLLSSSGEASGLAAAEHILKEYALLSLADRSAFFLLLRDQFGINADEAVASAERYRDTPTPSHMRDLQTAVEPRRQELLRRLNLAPGGTIKLVQMREQLLDQLPLHPDLREIDMDLLHLFQSWFNRGFLEVHRIDWRTPAVVLEKIIKYEAVHQISDWNELRRRIDPADRRLYAFFHPRLADEPLIFVEVALTIDVPATIPSILSGERDIVPPDQARTATFYSISNCQSGLRGVSFGNLLIKQVVEDLRRELPGLKTYVTLSPMPGFARWLGDMSASDSSLLQDMPITVPELQLGDWVHDSGLAACLEPRMLSLAAYYLIKAKNAAGAPLDPVARFHIGNGARLERINWRADLSAAGLRNGHGIMVNYAYRLGDIERNHEAFANTGAIPTAGPVARLLRHINVPERSVSLA